MTDIVERLRAWSPVNGVYVPLMDEAADEIERLEAALAKSCREDRAEFLGGCFHANYAEAEIERLRAALGEKP